MKKYIHGNKEKSKNDFQVVNRANLTSSGINEKISVFDDFFSEFFESQKKASSIATRIPIKKDSNLKQKVFLRSDFGMRRIRKIIERDFSEDQVAPTEITGNTSECRKYENFEKVFENMRETDQKNKLIYLEFKNNRLDNEKVILLYLFFFNFLMKN